MNDRAIPTSRRMIAVTLAAAGALLLMAPPRSQGAPGKGAPAGADAGGMATPGALKTYPSPYYTIYSDLGIDDVREATMRMTRMAEEYHDRTAGFSGVINQKFPFYLYATAEDYYRGGGPPGSAGVFMVRNGESKLMAIAIGKSDGRDGGQTWHVVQHEGFHQFAHAVIGGDMPMWVNEGLAEYFGEGLFTGDGFVTGLVPARRLQRVQESIREKKFKSIKEMMLLTNREWNADLKIENYDMAWSMTHFLAHGDDGRYQGAFAAFMKDIGATGPGRRRGRPTSARPMVLRRSGPTGGSRCRSARPARGTPGPPSPP